MDRQRPAFVSYARADSAFAQRLAADLKSNGAHVWLDQLDIRPGRQWDREVELALGTSNEMLVVLSPTAVESNNVMDEVAFALEEHKIVIPVLLADCRIPFRLRRYQYIDFRSDYETALQTLLSVLALDKPATPETVKEVVNAPRTVSEERGAAVAVAEKLAAREQAAQEKAARDQVARERAEREQAARDQAAHEKAEREREERKQKELAERAFWAPRVKTMLTRLNGCLHFYGLPDIPAQKLSRAQEICLAPQSEEVFGLVYYQGLFAAPSFIVFAESGMYIHTRLTRTRIDYSELRNMTISAESTSILELGNTQITIPASFSMQVLADALNSLTKDLPMSSAGSSA